MPNAVEFDRSRIFDPALQPIADKEPLLVCVLIDVMLGGDTGDCAQVKPTDEDDPFPGPRATPVTSPFTSGSHASAPTRARDCAHRTTLPLPTPPAPMRVTRRAAVMHCRTATSSSPRPMRLVIGIGRLLRCAPARGAVCLNGVGVGRAVRARFVARGGVRPVRWTVVRGRLPAGIRLSARTGSLTGVAHTAGSVRLTVRARDAVGGSARKTVLVSAG